MTNKEICDIAFQIERRINPLAGQQDVYGCGVGNFKRIDFNINKPQTYRFLDMSFITDRHDMFLLNTHIVRNSTTILKTLDLEKSHRLLETVDDLEQSILQQNENDFFSIFNKGWYLKKQTSSEIINNRELLDMDTELDNMSSIDGLKLCGAGGGGYFFIMIKKDARNTFLDKIENKFSKKVLIDISIDSDGVRGAKI
jgi:D-glycero-alpha-D-manno-heptose-7-phosphate kinase